LRFPLDNYLDLGADVIAARPAEERVDISVETILVAILGGLGDGLPLSVRCARSDPGPWKMSPEREPRRTFVAGAPAKVAMAAKRPDFRRRYRVRAPKSAVRTVAGLPP
jgi:hypothetical protein